MPKEVIRSEPPQESIVLADLATSIHIADLRVEFDGRAVLDGLGLDVDAGQIVGLVGASGCGKSTLLRTVAGLQEASGGVVQLSAGEPSNTDPKLAYVFQEATLLPWRTVFENVALPFELSELGYPESAANPILSALNAVGLDSATWQQYPRELSGGMRMRVSIARALATDPSILLLDEPFAALDDILRNRLNSLLLELWQARQRTILFVTHNIAEAVFLSHRVAVLGGGKVAKLIENELSWPRENRQRNSIEFAQMYGRVSTALEEASS